MGGTPCVAAFSTVRALSTSYNGKLYQVTRTDGTTLKARRQARAKKTPDSEADAAAVLANIVAAG
ncbi:MAG: arabinofuranosidase catalytic domain-containing protein [Polyangiaceae bacterium]